MEDLSFNTLSSDRLVVRRFLATDAEAFAAYRSDPNVARYQGWDSCSLDEAQRFIASLERVVPGAAGIGLQFAVALAPAGPLVGDCFLRCTPDESCHAELGFTFATNYQHKGYATEAVTRLLQYAFTTLDLHRVIAITDVRNRPAQRLLERLLFRLEGKFLKNAWYKGEWTSEFQYAQLQDEWRRTHGNQHDDMEHGTSDTLAGGVVLRDVEEGDLPILFEHQCDPTANQMAAFQAREREAFMTHWARILGNETVVKKTVLFGDQVAGNIVCYEQAGRWLIGYWLGKHFWGRGIATKALAELVTQVQVRPLHAHVAKHNVGSIRVLEKCGFAVSGEDESPCPASGEIVEEFVFTLTK